MQIDATTAIQIGAMIVLCWAICRDRNAKTLTKSAKIEALKTFRAVRVTSSTPRFAFDASRAEILKTEETGAVMNENDRDGYTLAIWARNNSGEIFHVRVNRGTTYVQHIPQSALGAQFQKSVKDRNDDA